MKKLILFIILNTPLFSLYYPDEIAPALQKLTSLEDFNTLVNEAEKEGPIKIEVRKTPSQFIAYWNGTLRRIILNKGANQDLGDLMISITFELHNAKRDHAMRLLESRAKKGKITSSEYVKAMERLEYVNAIETKQLLDHGIKRGVLPKSAHWPVDPDFEEHFLAQKQAGHAQFHATQYEKVAPNQHAMDQSERYLALSKILQFGSSHEKKLAQTEIQEEAFLHETLNNERSLELMKRYRLL